MSCRYEKMLGRGCSPAESLSYECVSCLVCWIVCVGWLASWALGANGVAGTSRRLRDCPGLITGALSRAVGRC